MISITKIFHFEAAHAISWHKGKCRNVHGHRYELHVSVADINLTEGDMIIDFSDLKHIVNSNVIEKLDHSLILCKEGEMAQVLANYNGNLVWTDREPTVEYLILLISRWLTPALPDHLKLTRLILWETKSSYAQLE